MKLFICSIAWLCAGPVLAGELVGAVVPPYPDGMASDMGSCLPEGEEICAHSIATLNGPGGSVSAIIAKTLVRHDDGRAVWKIIDVREAPGPTNGGIWAFEACHVDGIVDPSVIGLVSFKDMGGWIESEQTLWTVRFDVAARQLVELDPQNVTCVLPAS